MLAASRCPTPPIGLDWREPPFVPCHTPRGGPPIVGPLDDGAPRGWNRPGNRTHPTMWSFPHHCCSRSQAHVPPSDGLAPRALHMFVGTLASWIANWLVGAMSPVPAAAAIREGASDGINGRVGRARGHESDGPFGRCSPAHCWLRCSFGDVGFCGLCHCPLGSSHLLMDPALRPPGSNPPSLPPRGPLWA